MKWITRERPKIDRIACPWLISRFIDKDPEFLFATKNDVLNLAKEKDAIPFDVPGAELTHQGDNCSFDAFLLKYKINDPAVHALALIVRGADTDRPDISPESAGLLAISSGLLTLLNNDHQLLSQGFIIYDALFAWCQQSTKIAQD